MKLRLNKYLASLGLDSRRKIDSLIERRKVKVNGRTAKLGDKIDDTKDTIQVGKKIFKPSATPTKKEYWMVYKPTGVVSSTSDPRKRKVVTSLVKSKQRLYPVGRLDADSEGLIILTNDGKLTQKLTHPSHHVPKTYVVTTRGKVSRNGLNQIRRGLRLKKMRIAPAEIEILEKEENTAVFEITIHQGINHQIRRMMKAINLEVTRLVRVAVGGLELGNLRPGKAVELTKADIQEIFS